MKPRYKYVGFLRRVYPRDLGLYWHPIESRYLYVTASGTFVLVGASDRK